MSDFNPDDWEEHDRYYYKHKETGDVIHEEAYFGKKERADTIANADVTPNAELRRLVESWRERAEGKGGGELAGVEWCADELEELLDG